MKSTHTLSRRDDQNDKGLCHTQNYTYSSAHDAMTESVSELTCGVQRVYVLIQFGYWTFGCR